MKHPLEQLKDAEIEKEIRKIKLLEAALYKAIDEALYGDAGDAHLSHADVLDAIIKTLYEEGIFPTSSCGPDRA